MEGCHVQFCSVLSYKAQDHLHRIDSMHNLLGPPALIINHEKIPTTWLQANLLETFSLLWFSLPRWLFFWGGGIRLPIKTNRDITYLINLYYFPQISISSPDVFTRHSFLGSHMSPVVLTAILSLLHRCLGQEGKALMTASHLGLSIAVCPLLSVSVQLWLSLSVPS